MAEWRLGINTKPPEYGTVMLDEGNEQRRIGPRSITGYVSHDTTVCFLDLHQGAELRRPSSFSLRMIFAYGSKMLAIFPGVRVCAQHVSASLSDYLTANDSWRKK